MAKKKLKLKSMKEIKDSIKEEKGKKKRKSNKKRHIGQFVLMGFITLGIVFASVGIAFGLYIVFTAPEFKQEALYNKEATILRWKDGSIMARIGSENRELKNYEDFPQVLVDALVATEDARFFQHSGFDAARFTKASLGQLAGNSSAGGASTLSMQLAKNYFNGDEASGIEGIIRKFKDIYMAVFKIENSYTKEQIIEMYLNSWWFAGGGTNFGGIYGVEQASQYYFGKSVSDITLPESAVLVGMVNNPLVFNPFKHPDDSDERKNIVLSLMYRHGYITEQEMKDAQSIRVESLLTNKDDSASSFAYQHLIDYTKEEIYEKEGIDLYKNSGYDVTTSFDKGIQDIINNMQNGAAYQFRDDLMQVGTAVISVEDGSIVAMGAGRNYVAQGTNRANNLSTNNLKPYRRQPGSTIKPLIDYGPLIEYNNASTGHMFIDFKYGYDTGGIMNNWDNRNLGVMILKDALSQSRNTTALQAFHQVDKGQIKEFLNRLGIDEDNYGDDLFESYSIGGLPKGLSPIESAAAYSTFARKGYYIEPYSYKKITNTETEETIEYKYEMVRAMSEETAYLITDVLLQATRENVGGPINSSLRGTIASKSGTSNIDSASAKELGVSVYATPDHWVNTYNSDYAISMWMGYDILDKDHYFTTPTGSTPRGQISAYLANNILNSNKKFERPSGVVSVTIEKNILPPKRASEYTPDNMKLNALFKSGTEPGETSNRFQKLEAPTNGKATSKDKTITITWENAKTPKALDSNAARTELANYLKTYKKNYSRAYASFESEYLKLYDSYNTANLGTFGYHVYVKDKNGNLTSLGWTQKNSYTYTAPTGGEYEFVIKSSYSIFKNNQSNGITVKTKIESQEEFVVTPIDFCVSKGSVLNPKDGIKVTLNNKDITSSVTVIASSVDTETNGTKDITYTVTYNSETKKVKGKITVSDSCQKPPVTDEE